MIRLLVVLALVTLPAAVRADCTREEERDLARQGLTDAEIDARCKTGIPKWLSGEWSVTRNMGGSNVPGFGPGTPIVETYRIEVVGSETLRLWNVRDADLLGMRQETSMEVREATMKGSTLNLRTYASDVISPNETTEYQIETGGEKQYLSGSWRSHAEGTMGLPPVEMWGSLSMVRTK